MAHPNNTWLFIVVLTVNLPPQILEYFTVMQQMGIIQVVELGGLLGLIACMLLSNFFAITMYWYAVTVTKRQHNQLFRRSVICIYSLSERYQIIENFRVFRLCKSFFISASTMNIFGCLIFIVPYVINVNDYQTDLWKDIFMAFLNIYAIPVLTCPIFADKEMRMIFRNSFPYFHIHRPLPHEKTPPKGPAESNEYFKMLNLQWN
ncbi:unnamed protein product, partial [Mesorhabditis belari]|uniref:Uncharacterized protein n=1 Tax=Mesorhabditis belari TaxID=2138241 RepID=A0AAF3ESQ7_9BILA